MGGATLRKHLEFCFPTEVSSQLRRQDSENDITKHITATTLDRLNRNLNYIPTQISTTASEMIRSIKLVDVIANKNISSQNIISQ